MSNNLRVVPNTDVQSIAWLQERVRSWDQDSEGFEPIGCLLSRYFVKEGLGDDDDFDRVLTKALDIGAIHFASGRRYAAAS